MSDDIAYTISDWHWVSYPKFKNNKLYMNIEVIKPIVFISRINQYLKFVIEKLWQQRYVTTLKSPD